MKSIESQTQNCAIEFEVMLMRDKNFLVTGTRKDFGLLSITFSSE